MIVKVAPVHEIQYEAELVWRVEGVGHAHNEGAVVAYQSINPDQLSILNPTTLTLNHNVCW